MITAAATASDLDGYFFIGFEGHWSERVAYDATADEMASALAGIPAVGHVQVKESALMLVLVLALVLVLTLLSVLGLGSELGLVPFPGRIVEPVTTSIADLRRNLWASPPS